MDIKDVMIVPSFPRDVYKRKPALLKAKEPPAFSERPILVLFQGICSAEAQLHVGWTLRQAVVSIETKPYIHNR